jgi:hypothetical protein
MIGALITSSLFGGIGGSLAGIAFVLCASDIVLELLQLPPSISEHLDVLIVPFFVAGAILGSFSCILLGLGHRELKLLSPAFSGADRFRPRIPVLVALLTAVLSWHVLGSHSGPGVLPIQRGHSAPDLESGLATQFEIVKRAGGPTNSFQLSVAEFYYRHFERVHQVAAAFLGLMCGYLLGATGAALMKSVQAGLGLLFWSLWHFSAGFAAGAVSIGGFGLAFNAFGSGSNQDTVVFSILNAGIPGGWIAVVGGMSNFLLESRLRRPIVRAGAAAALAFLGMLSLFAAGTTSRFILSLERNLPVSGVWSELGSARDVVLHILLYFEGIHFPEMQGFPAAPFVMLAVPACVALMLWGVFYGLNMDEETKKTPRECQQSGGTQPTV